MPCFHLAAQLRILSLFCPRGSSATSETHEDMVCRSSTRNSPTGNRRDLCHGLLLYEVIN